MSRDSRTHDDLERNLRAGADAWRRPPPSDLGARVRAQLATTPRLEPAPAFLRPARLVAAVAALFVLALALWLTRRPTTSVLPEEKRSPSVVLLSRELLQTGTRVLDLPQAAEHNLRSEARNLWLDTSRAAEGVVRGLPAPMRGALARM